MGNRFSTEFVYIIDDKNTPHFVMSYYFADLSGSYRSDIYLANKSYCVTDLFLTDEVEEKGEFLPHVKEKEWREFFSEGPSVDIKIILEEAELAEIAVSKIVFFRTGYSSRMLLEEDGFVVSAQGVQDLDIDLWEEAYAQAKKKTESTAEQQDEMVEWIVEQIQNGNFPTAQ